MTIIRGPLKCITPPTHTHTMEYVLLNCRKVCKAWSLWGIKNKEPKREKLLAQEKSLWNSIHYGILFSFKREGSLVICDSMDGPEGHYATWNKPHSEVQKPINPSHHKMVSIWGNRYVQLAWFNHPILDTYIIKSLCIL
jgi:hypothetical protein